MIRSLALCAVLSSLPLAAIAGPTTQGDVVTARLLPGWQDKKGHHMTALHLALAPEWKTYWRSPGDAGIPPAFDWSGSENLKYVLFHWPSPSVFHTNGMQSIGYHRELVLPIEVVANDPSKPVLVRVQVGLGVCRDICIPAEVDLMADLTPPGAPDPAISAALRDRPATASEAGMTGIGCTVEPIRDGLRLTASIDLPTQGSGETVVFESGSGSVWVSEAVSSRSGGRLTAEAEMVAPSGQPFALDRSSVVVTVISAQGAVEIRGCPAP